MQKKTITDTLNGKSYTILVLVEYNKYWNLYALKGHKINGDPFRGDEYLAKPWATNFLSSWPGYVFITEEEYGKLYGKSFKTSS